MITRNMEFLKGYLSILVVLILLSNVLGNSLRQDPESMRMVTPNPIESRGYNYIPIRGQYQNLPPELQYKSVDHEDPGLEISPPSTAFAPSQLILTVLRTVLDVVRNINKSKRFSKSPQISAAVNATKRIDKNQARGMYDYYDDHHDHTTTTTMAPKPRYTDPWAGYYDFIINEGSYKFWVVFQLFTAGLLLYSCLAAIYYAKFNPITPDYDREYDDYFLGRSVRSTRSLDSSILPSGLTWINSPTFQFILDAIAQNKFESS